MASSDVADDRTIILHASLQYLAISGHTTDRTCGRGQHNFLETTHATFSSSEAGR